MLKMHLLLLNDDDHNGDADDDNDDYDEGDDDVWGAMALACQVTVWCQIQKLQLTPLAWSNVVVNFVIISVH